MEHEILFRGKRVDNGEWIAGDLSQIKAADHYFIDNIMIEKITRGQYTGLTDRNGVKIFEGDIIKEKGKKKNAYLVEYSKNIAGFITRGFGVLSTPCMNVGTMKFYEVIGNIHDDPELMKGE